MAQEEIIKDLWSLANTVTAFSILQSLTFTYALGKEFANIQDSHNRTKVMFAVICLVAAVIYIVLVL